MRAIYRQIISACLACEQTQKIAYLGPAGTFSHSAAQVFFGYAAELHPTKTIFSAVRETEKAIVILPSCLLKTPAKAPSGATMDALLDTPLKLCGELMLRVRHNLLSKRRLS